MLIWHPTTPADLDTVLAAEAWPEAARFVMPWSRERHAAALGDPDLLHAVLRDSEMDVPIGFLLLAGLTNPHRSVELRRLIVTEPGRGLGRAALAAVVQWVFAERGAHRLWLDVFVDNARARHLYRTAGFAEEGVLREAYADADGTYRSLVIMSLLRPEWDAAPSNSPCSRDHKRL